MFIEQTTQAFISTISARNHCSNIQIDYHSKEKNFILTNPANNRWLYIFIYHSKEPNSTINEIALTDGNLIDYFVEHGSNLRYSSTSWPFVMRCTHLYAINMNYIDHHAT